MRITDSGEVLIPNDFRARTLGRGALNGFALNEIRHIHALRNLESHVESELEISEMRGYQQEVVRKIQNFLRFPEEDENGNPIQAGYIKLPTATGKTAIFAHTVGEISRPIGDRTQPLKTLVLVPGRDLIEQTVGITKNKETELEEMTRGFAKFAPHMDVTEYHGGKKDLSGDVVVMTYQSLIVAMREGRFDPNMFDAVILDEAHRALGATTKQYVNEIIQDKITIGFSATTEYGANKKVSDVLPTEIMRMELREAVEDGYLAPMRCWAIGTNEKIVASGRGDISEEEMQKLITSEFRNNAAIKFAQEFIQNGQQGIISCVPGQKLRHAREIAERLNNESIIDAQTGEIRNIKAIAVHGEMTIKQRRDIYEAYEKGEIDVLTTVDLLNEGWDSTKAKFLINLRPTTSAVLGTQRIGRILRPDEEGQIATIVEFIDEIEKPGSKLFTFYHAMEEREVTQGKIYGKPSREGRGEIDAPDPKELPPEIRELIAHMGYKTLDELIFGNFPVAETDEISINRFCDVTGASKTEVERKIEELGWVLPLRTILGNKGTRVGRVLSEALQQTLSAELEEHISTPKANKGDVTITMFSRIHGFSEVNVKEFLESVGFDLVDRRTPTGIFPTLTYSQQEAVIKLINERCGLPIREGEIAIADLAREENVSDSIIHEIVKKNSASKPLRRRKGLRKTQAIEESLAIKVKAILNERRTRQHATEGEMSRVRFAHSIGVGDVVLQRAIDELGLDLPLRVFGTGESTPAIREEHAQLIINYLEKEIHTPKAQPGEQSITEFSRRIIKRDPKRVKKTIDELGIRLPNRKFGPSHRISPALLPEHQEFLKRHFGFKEE